MEVTSMKRIVYVGMDVHLNSYTLCCLETVMFGEDKVFGQMQMGPSVSNVLRYVTKIADRYEEPSASISFICGYEAGFAGYSLYHELTAAGLECIILAPSTMVERPKHKIKTDKRDAEHIARCLAYGTYQPVHVPTKEDEQVRDYLRMRNDHQLAFKTMKQQINAFCLRLGLRSPGRSKWTQAHLRLLHQLELSALDREILNEYLMTYEMAANRIALFDQRIEELAAGDRYRDKVKRLSCFIGIKTYTSLSLIVETSDFQRFAKSHHFASYVGLTPGEVSSGDTIRRTGITKAGNRHMRHLL
jgi:transposase